MTLLAGQPYPQQDGWLDMRPYLVNDWTRRGGAAVAIKVDGNDVKISAALIIGTDQIIAEGLTGIVSGNRPITALVQTSDSSRPLNINLRPDGILTVEGGHWGFVQTYNNMIVGGEAPR